MNSTWYPLPEALHPCDECCEWLAKNQLMA